MIKPLIFSISLFSFSVLASPTPYQLFETINQRLSYMEDVALYKANNQKPIEDSKREVIVIENASKSAEKSGLNKQSVIGFFKAQISAAKAIQYRYRADLLSQSEPNPPRDLNKVIRPALIELGKKINTEIADYLQQGGMFTEQDFLAFNTALDTRYLEQSDKEKLFKALVQIKLQ